MPVPGLINGSEFEFYYKKYSGVVFRRAFYMLKDEDMAASIMQDVFLKLFEYKKPIDKDRVFSLLYRITTNKSLDVIRAKKRNKTIVSDDVITQIACSDNHVSKILDLDLLKRIFSKEKDTTKLIATLYFIDGLTHEEVAKEVGMSTSGVRKRLKTFKERVQLSNEYEIK